MPDLSEILAAASLREESVELCVDGALNARFAELQRELAAALEKAPSSLADGGQAGLVERAMTEVRSAMAEHSFTFRFRALGAKAWSDLRAAHPGRDGKSEAWNVETFPPALIVACCVDPQLDAAGVERLFEVLNQGQRDLLFQAAWDANQGSDVPFWRAASEQTPS